MYFVLDDDSVPFSIVSCSLTVVAANVDAAAAAARHKQPL